MHQVFHTGCRNTTGLILVQLPTIGFPTYVVGYNHVNFTICFIIQGVLRAWTQWKIDLFG